MAEGYECDRCGSLHSGGPDTLVTVGDGEPRRGRQDSRDGHLVHEGVGMGDDMYDVCSGCRSDFEDWWGAGE